MISFHDIPFLNITREISHDMSKYFRKEIYLLIKLIYDVTSISDILKNIRLQKIATSSIR
jgi:hypothetical protein